MMMTPSKSDLCCCFSVSPWRQNLLRAPSVSVSVCLCLVVGGYLTLWPEKQYNNTRPEYVIGMAGHHQCVCMLRLPTFILEVFHLHPGHPCRHNPSESLKRDQWQAFLIHISFQIAPYSPTGIYAYWVATGGYFLIPVWCLLKVENGWLNSFKTITLSGTLTKNSWKQLRKQKEIYISDWSVPIQERVICHVCLEWSEPLI